MYASRRYSPLNLNLNWCSARPSSYRMWSIWALACAMVSCGLHTRVKVLFCGNVRRKKLDSVERSYDFIFASGRRNTVNSLLTDTSLKRTPLESGHVELVPTVLQSFTSSPSKADTSLKWTVGAGPECVCLRGSWLWYLLNNLELIS